MDNVTSSAAKPVPAPSGVRGYETDPGSGAAPTGGDLTVINDAGSGRWAVKLPGATIYEIGRHCWRSGQQESAHGDRGLTTNIESRLVLQHHQSVRGQVAQNPGRIGIVNLIPNYR